MYKVNYIFLLLSRGIIIRMNFLYNFHADVFGEIKMTLFNHNINLNLF